MGKNVEHPWGVEKVQVTKAGRRKARQVLTRKQADSLARNIHNLEERRSYNDVGGVDEDFDL